MFLTDANTDKNISVLEMCICSFMVSKLARKVHIGLLICCGQLKK